MKEKLLSPFLDVVTKESTNGDRVTVLDGVRGLAVVIVLMSHTSALGMYGQGSLGVFLFYFLSGYVLSLPFLETPKKILCLHQLLHYLKNRVFRLMPIYCVVVGITAYFLDQSAIWFFWNVSLLKGWNHFWSVAQEARFYILFPPVVMALSFFQPVGRLFVLLFFIVLSFKWREVVQVDMLDGRQASLFFYLFLAGSFTAHFMWTMHRRTSVKISSGWKLALSATSSIVFASFFLTSDWFLVQFWRRFLDLPPNLALNGWAMPRIWMVLFFSFFVSILLHPGSLVARLLNSYAMRHLGILSYGLYLIHMVPLMKFKQLGYAANTLLLLTFAASYVSAFIGYVCVERPFLLLKKYNRAIQPPSRSHRGD